MEKLKIIGVCCCLCICAPLAASQNNGPIYRVNLRPEGQTEESVQLKQAIQAKNSERVKDILNKPNVDINALLPGRLFTPLGLAIYLNAPEIVELLLDRNADTEEYSLGLTPLTLATIQPVERKILTLLIEHNAEIDTRNRNGKTAVQIALQRRHRERAQELLNRGASLTQADIAQLPLAAQQLAETLLQDSGTIQAQ